MMKQVDLTTAQERRGDRRGSTLTISGMGVERWRLVVALLVAPAVVVPLTFVGYGVLNVLQADGFRGDGRSVWSTAANFALATLVAAYVIQAAIGAPISLFLARRGRFSAGRMLATGAICGALPFIVAYLIWTESGSPRQQSGVVFAGLGTVFGAAIAAVTYVLARGRTEEARGLRHGPE